MSNNNCSPSFSTFLAGALLGAATALLLTPRTGKETRKLLVDYGVNLKDNLPEDLRHKAEVTIERGRHLIEQGQEMIMRGNDIINEGKEYIDEKKKALNEAIEAGRQAMAEEKENLAAAMEEDNA
jgi:gas vesicle protein